MAAASGLDASDATVAHGDIPSRTFASGRYAVVRALPEGGQKIVYLVRDTALDRDCALSLIKAGQLQPDDLERLRREAQAMARLGTHAHLVTIFDIGDEDGRPYIVSEFVAGGELRHEIRAAAGPLPLDRALAVIRDVARALAFAHARGIVHRDIKPANIESCLVPEGEPLFELACLERLNRNGITLESAEQDFVDGREFGESGFRTGRQGVYQYE